MGEYQAQAAIAALHDQAPSHDATSWSEIVALYDQLGRLSASPIVSMNRAVAIAMVHGPDAGLEQLEALRPQLGTHYRFGAVRAHLLQMAGRLDEARAEYAAAAGGTANMAERHYLTMQAARLGTP
jgi:predicted RNA polymerase sigma factor